MEEAITRYYPLGSKTLAVLVLARSIPSLFLVIPLAAGVWLVSAVPVDYINISVQLVAVYTIAWMIFTAAMFFIGWLQYNRYAIELDQKTVKISTGLISVQQRGVPYRRIQDVKIFRGIFDQLMGVSDLIVAIAEEDEVNESSLVLPALDRSFAAQLQDTLLKRAQVEQFNVTEIPAGQSQNDSQAPQ